MRNRLFLVALLASACAEDGVPIDDLDTGMVEQAATSGPPGTVQTTVLARENLWSYWSEGPPPASWKTERAFFTGGYGVLGFGESYIDTPLEPGQTAYYFFTDFPTPPGTRALFLRVMYDDGFVFYLNGHEGGRASMPSGTVSHGTLATGHEAGARYVTYDISAQIPHLVAPDTYPFNALAFEVHQASASSSDVVFDAELIAWVDGPVDVTTKEEIPRGGMWHFWDRAASPGDWKSTGYADAGWSAGPGPLGFGEDYLATTLNPGTITTYYRKQFTIEGEVSGLTGDVMYDDGFVVYLNGREVGRAAMPRGIITAATLSTGHEANNAYRSFDWDWAVVPHLRRGLNTIAVEVHQSSASSSDLVFDLGLVVEDPWTLQQTGIAPWLWDVWFADAQRGWAVGWDGILRTIDGGQTWTLQPSGTTEELFEITFADDGLHGWISAGNGIVVRTADGGATWTAVDTGLRYVGKVSSSDGLTAWVGGIAESDPWTAVLYRTTDGGATWTLVEERPGMESVTPYFADAQHGWIVEQHQELFGQYRISRTDDGGATWSEQWSGGDFYEGVHGGFAVIDANNAIMVGGGDYHTDQDEFKLITHDGGATWTELPPTANHMRLHDVMFVDALNGWAIGAGGSIIRTADGGDTWTIQQVARTYDWGDGIVGDAPFMYGIHMADLLNGWAVGSFGTVLHTTTGGEGKL